MIYTGEVSNYTDEHILFKVNGGVVDAEMQKRFRKYGVGCELRMLDKRRIGAEQRKKIYAIFKDIAEYTGHSKVDTKHLLKAKFLEENEKAFVNWFSLSDCSVEVAYEFTNYLIGFCLENDIPTADTLLNYCPDIERYMYMCLKIRKCVICGIRGSVHHIDAIGMGNNRRTTDDSKKLKICLCDGLGNNRDDGAPEGCHGIAHRMGWKDFSKKYHVKGILFNE